MAKKRAGRGLECTGEPPAMDEADGVPVGEESVPGILRLNEEPITACGCTTDSKWRWPITNCQWRRDPDRDIADAAECLPRRR